jgi:molybdopterin converting factor subunit 1
MVKVKVLFFASTREQTGQSNIEIDLGDDPATATTEILLQILNNAYPNLNVSLDFITLAINKKYRRGVVLLQDGDEVALLPPISGG